MDKETQDANDLKLFEKFLKTGLVSVKTLIMKSPANRTDREVEFMTLYLKFKHASVFQNFENQTIQAFIPRL